MPKRKKSVVSLVRSIANRKKKSRENPSGWDLGFLEDVGAGGAAMVATIVPARLAGKAIQNRWDSPIAKHLQPILGAVLFCVYWLLTAKVKRLKRYQLPVLIGAGIGVMNLAVRTWLPQYAWVLGGGASPEMAPRVGVGAVPIRRVPDLVSLPLDDLGDASSSMGDASSSLGEEDEDDEDFGSLSAS